MSMSINQILQPNKLLNGKVKIFYTFKGSNIHCLSTFDIQLKDYKDRKWVNIPLKQCITSVCASCPDQLVDSQTAIYSANFEDSLTEQNWSPLHDSKSNIIWEGHGALSTILSDEHSDPQVTGKLIMQTDSSLKYDCYIEILIQLHPIQQQPHTIDTYLPPMRSIWTSPSTPAPHYPLKTTDSKNTTSPSNTRHQRLPSLSSNTSAPTTLDLNWTGSSYDPTNNSPSSSFIDQDSKRTKLTPTYVTTHHHMPRKQLPPAGSSSSRMTDTYYHQSRRKKRDTKPPNANDVRPFVEIERRPDGSYVLPAEVDSWTVLDLGTVVWDKAAFHNQRYIYPVGYRVKKWYRSMVDPHSDTQYTCEILDGGEEPIFQLNADDNPSECWRGPTPTTVWTIAVRRAFAIRNMDYGHNPVGPDFFGLRKNTIAKMIQDLPNADKCKNYIWQNFEVMNNNKGKSARRSNIRLPIKHDEEAEETSSSTTEQNT